MLRTPICIFDRDWHFDLLAKFIITPGTENRSSGVDVGRRREKMETMMGEKMKKAAKSRKLDVRFISLSLQASQSSGNIIYNYTWVEIYLIAILIFKVSIYIVDIHAYKRKFNLDFKQEI